MYEGGLQKITITEPNDGIASIMLGKDRFLDIDFNRDPMVAIHKKKKEPAIAVDAKELLSALQNLVTN